MRRIRNRNYAADDADGEQQAAVSGQLGAGDAGAEIVDGVAEHQRRRSARRRA